MAHFVFSSPQPIMVIWVHNLSGRNCSLFVVSLPVSMPSNDIEFLACFPGSSKLIYLFIPRFSSFKGASQSELNCNLPQSICLSVRWFALECCGIDMEMWLEWSGTVGWVVVSVGSRNRAKGELFQDRMG